MPTAVKDKWKKEKSAAQQRRTMLNVCSVNIDVASIFNHISESASSLEKWKNKML